MPLICRLWPRCRHVQWHNEEGHVVQPTLDMLPTSEVVVYPERCQVCAELGHPYYVPRGRHLWNADIAAEEVFHAAQPGDSFEDVFRKADMAAAMHAPIDHYHEGPLGGWGPGAGWDPEIPDDKISSTASPSAPSNSPSIDTSTTDSSAPAGKETLQTSKTATHLPRETTEQSPELGEDLDSGASLPAPDSSPGPGSPGSAIDGSSDTPISLPPPGSTSAGFTINASNAAVTAPPTAVVPTIGLTLILNGVTYPRIENGRERWYTQRPGHSNNYSRYSDLVKFDTAKGGQLAPKASKIELQAARDNRTFG